MVKPVGVLPPNGTFNLHFGVPLEGKFDAIMDGKQWTYIYGELNYVDGSELTKGVTKWCIYLAIDEFKRADLFHCQTYDDLK